MLQEYSTKVSKLKASIELEMDSIEENNIPSRSINSQGLYEEAVKKLTSDYQQVLNNLANLEENIKGMMDYAQSKEPGLFWKK